MTRQERDWVGSPTILSPRRSSRSDQGPFDDRAATGEVSSKAKSCEGRDLKNTQAIDINERDRRASGTIIRTSSDRSSLPCVRSYGCDKSTLSQNYSRIGRSSSDVRAWTNHARLINPVPGHHLCQPDSCEPFVYLFFSRRA